MTHTSTEQEHAEFEAWARDRYPSIDLTRDRNDYSKALAKDYWSLWQAARRAPAVLVPQGYEYDMIDRFLRNNLHDDDYAEYSAALDELAAAPQPPEAAPVQLPDYGIDTANHAGIRVRGYTKDQVLAILAQHGIKTK